MFTPRSVTIGFSVAALTLVSISVVIGRDDGAERRSQNLDEEELHSFVPSGMAVKRLEWEHMRTADPTTHEVPPGIRARELAYSRTLPSLRLGKNPEVNWRLIGPTDVGGRTRALRLDISDPNRQTMLAAGISSGIWKSTNGGRTWRSTMTSDQLKSVSSLVQDVRDGSRLEWYAGTGEWRGSTAGIIRGDGIYKSIDGGETWQLLPSTRSSTPQSFDNAFDYVHRIAIDPSNLDQTEVYAATATGLRRSVDGGISWSEDAFYSALGWSDVVVTHGGEVYFVWKSRDETEGGVFRSADGLTWSDITPGDWSIPSSGRTYLTVSDDMSTSLLYALTYTVSEEGEEGATLFRYRSGDSTWTDLSDLLPAYGAYRTGLQLQSGYNMLVEVNPFNPDEVFIGGTNLFRSSDGFEAESSFVHIAGFESDHWEGDHHADQHVLIFDPETPGVAYTGSDGGIHKTIDISSPVVSWTDLNKGYLTAQFYTVTQDENSGTSLHVSGGTQDNGTWSTVSGNNPEWSKILGGDGSHTTIRNHGSIQYVSSQRGRTIRYDFDSDGSRTSWSEVTPAALSDGDALFIHPYIVAPDDANVLFYPIGGRLFRNSDTRAIQIHVNESTHVNWVQLGDFEVGRISALAAGPAEPHDAVFIGTNEGTVYRVDDVDDPAMANAVDITCACFPEGAYTSDIDVSNESSDEIALVFSNWNVQSVFHSSDGGVTWRNISGNLEENPDGSGSGPSVRSVAFAKDQLGEVLFVGTTTGVYSTRDIESDPVTWVLQSADEIGNTVVDALSFRSTDTRLVAGTHGRGVFSRYMTTAPVAAFERSPTEGRAPIEIQFDASPSFDADGDSLSFRWDFGDGASSTSMVADHSYVTAGEYRVTLVVSDGLRSDSTSMHITVASGVAAEALEVPNRFALYQPYPNPFRDRSTIAFDLPESAPARIEVRDMLGRRVRVLASGEVLSAGSHMLELESDGLASGSYLVTMTSGSFFQTHEIILVR